jgi:hypothetical protein
MRPKALDLITVNAAAVAPDHKCPFRGSCAVGSCIKGRLTRTTEWRSSLAVRSVALLF